MTAPHTQCQPDTDDAAPRPWRSISGDSQICDKNGMFVADVAQGISGTCWPTSRANARLTVEAVNNHETLLNNVAVMHKHMTGAAADIAALQEQVDDLTIALRDVLDSGALSAMEGCTCESCAPIARARALVPSLEDRK